MNKHTDNIGRRLEEQHMGRTIGGQWEEMLRTSGRYWEDMGGHGKKRATANRLKR